MDAMQVLVQGFDDSHAALRDDMAQVDPEVMFWQPAPGLNHVGFLFWHLVRDEDVVVSYQAGQPDLWQADGWHQRLGMDPREQGTGMDSARLEAFRYDAAQFMAYADAVWRRTPRLLERLAEADLDRPAWPGSAWNVSRQLVEGCLCHSWVHLGEIRYVMGLRGWRFRE